MRILAATPYYEPEGGGLERYAHHVLKRLAARGHDVVVHSFTRDKPGVRIQDAVSVRRIRPWFFLGNAPVHPPFLRRFRRTLDQFRPDAVLAHSPVPFPAEMAWLAARDAGVPFVLTYHAGRLTSDRRGLKALADLDRATLEAAMLRQAQGLIAVSPYVRDHALARQRERVAIIPPGVDTSLFRPGSVSARPRVLFVAPLDTQYRWKGLDVLLEAWPRIVAATPDAQLRLVGVGDRLDDLRRWASTRDDVRVLGRLGNEALAREMQRARVLVLPSTSDAESFGMVMAEANACGRPVVASRVGGIPDFVDDGVNGLLVHPGLPSELAEAVGHILSDPTAADMMGRAGLKRVRRRHDWPKLADATEALLEGFVARPSAAAAATPGARPSAAAGSL